MFHPGNMKHETGATAHTGIERHRDHPLNMIIHGIIGKDLISLEQLHSPEALKVTDSTKESN